MGSPFDFEIKARKAGNYPVRKSPLPQLNSWQYGRELYSDDDFYSMINAYRSWVYVASSKNATTVANVPLRLYVAKNNKGSLKGYPTRAVSKAQEIGIRENAFLSNIPAVRKAVEFEEVLEHPYHTLMRNVNPFMNTFDLFEMTQLWQELTGNCYWNILSDKFGTPKEIWTIPPQFCKIIPDAQKFISGYKYIKGQNEVLLEESEVIHFKMANPKSQYYGYSPFSSIADIYGLDRSINEYEEAMFRNGGNSLSGLFETDQELGDHEFERLKTEIQQAFSGPRNAGKQPLLDHGLKYKALSVSPKEMAHLGGREFVKEQILNSYGISLSMYSKDSNRANLQGATWLYLSSTIQPRLQRFQEKLNEKLIPRYSDRLFVKFDNCVPEDDEFKLNKQVKYVQNGLETINEIRKEDGKIPFDSRFDEPLLQLNTTVIDEILSRVVKGSIDGNNIS
jgi:HK97 family phage portal protein